MILVLIFASYGAFANTSNLFLTCEDNDIPTPNGVARIIVDIFKTSDSRYSATLEMFIESTAPRRFRQTEFSVIVNSAGMILMPVGKSLEVANDGSEVEMANGHFQLGVFSIPGMENVTEVYFSTESSNDLAIHYLSENCHGVKAP